MTRTRNWVLITVFAAAFLATLPAVAAKPPSAGVPDNVAGTSAPAQATAEPGRFSAASGTRGYTLRYRAGPSDALTQVPGPVVLYVPHGYAPIREMFGPAEGPGLTLLTLYPSFGPATPGAGRCGIALCGDEISAALQVAPDPPQGARTGSLRDEGKPSLLAQDGSTVFQDVPAPFGYEEAFTASRAATASQSRLHTEYFAYHDGRGELQLGQCDLASANPTCLFRSFDPETHIWMLYDLPMTLLPQRQAIESGLRTLVGGWMAELK